MNLSQLLQQKRRQILEIAPGYGERKVRLSGSVARGEATETSDLDLLTIAIKQDLEDYWDARWMWSPEPRSVLI